MSQRIDIQPDGTVNLVDVRVEDDLPRAYRLKQDGSCVVLQGLFYWYEGFSSGGEWRDIPTACVESD